SGVLTGEIQAFFYRYKSVGGLDYVTDIVIGPRRGQQTVATRPGDSGTLWFLDSPSVRGNEEDRPEGMKRARRFHAVAMQWGGDVLASPSGIDGTQFALATSISSVLRALDVEIIRDWHIGLSEYWGKVGHYKVGAAACQLVTDPKL